jgi:VCPO second helical-bundle domain
MRGSGGDRGGNALLDASIAVWDAKVTYDSVRPVSAVRFLYAGQMIEAWAGPFQGTHPLPPGRSRVTRHRPADRPTGLAPRLALFHRRAPLARQTDGHGIGAHPRYFGDAGSRAPQFGTFRAGVGRHGACCGAKTGMAR